MRVDLRHKVKERKEMDRGNETYFLEIAETPISNQQTIILNESLRWILFVSSTLHRLGKAKLTSGAKMTLSIVSN
jgi:hypothetical protein